MVAENVLQAGELPDADWIVGAKVVVREVTGNGVVTQRIRETLAPPRPASSAFAGASPAVFRYYERTLALPGPDEPKRLIPRG